MNQQITDSLKQAALKSLENPGVSEPLPKTLSIEKPILYLFRHCQTTDNVNKIFSGSRRDPHLTEKGIDQAEKIAKLLKDKEIDLFMSPPQSRCLETLSPLKRLFPNALYVQRGDLKERDYGDLTGKNKEEIMREYPEKAILWRRSWDNPPPNGESLKKVWETRVKKFCEDLEQKMKTEKINIAYCGTNNTIRLIRWHFEKMSQEKMLTLENPYGDYASYHVV